MLTTGEPPFLTDYKQIKAWLKSMEVEGWKLNENGLVDVDYVVDLRERLGSLKRLPIRFGKVRCDFFCGNNQLESLVGSPMEVGGYFACDNNQLVSLKGCPKKVAGAFWCDSNKLISLEGAPKQAGGDFDCSKNQIVSLEGVPKEVDGDFFCNNNQLVSLEGAPKTVGGSFYCNNNQLVSLEGAPKEVVGDFHCHHNLLVDFRGLVGENIGGKLVVNNSDKTGPDNVFVSLDGLPKEFYSKVEGLEAVLELIKKRAMSLSVNELVGLDSEVGLG